MHDPGFRDVKLVLLGFCYAVGTLLLLLAGREVASVYAALWLTSDRKKPFTAFVFGARRQAMHWKV